MDFIDIIYNKNNWHFLVFILILFLTSMRIHILESILRHMKNNYKGHYNHINPDHRTISHFVFFGRAILFNFNFLFKNHYVLDNKLARKKGLYWIVTLIRLVTFFIFVLLFFIKV